MGINGREKKKQKLFDKSNVCGICGEPVGYKEANLDHIVPKSKGGSNQITNLRISHFHCNSRRGDKT
jgi:5-methylcytosine-specific restriction endonuclease McrA